MTVIIRTTLDDKATHEETIREAFMITTVDQRAADNGMWIKIVNKDPLKPDTWIEYDPDRDIIAVIE